MAKSHKNPTFTYLQNPVTGEVKAVEPGSREDTQRRSYGWKQVSRAVYLEWICRKGGLVSILL